MSHRPSAASLLAVLAMAVAVVPVASAAVLSGDAGTAAGGVLVAVVPYALVAVALTGRSVWSKGVGLVAAGTMTWLTSFAAVEAVLDLRSGDPVRPASAPFLALTLLGLGMVVLGARDTGRAVHATGYWNRTPRAARLALLGAAGWAVILVADTYLTANPPLGRMLLAPALAAVHVAAALMLRSGRLPAAAGGLLLVVAAAAGTGAFWLADAPYLTMGGGAPSVLETGYFTQLPWPILLALSLALDAAVVATAAAGLAVRAWVPPAGGRPAVAAPGRRTFAGRMDMRIERTIDKPPPLVEAALRTGASTWLPGLASEDADTTELDVRIAGTRIARRVLVATGPVAAGDGPVRCRLPISWAAELHPERYPTLTGSLEVEDMASRQTRLVLVASYDPPAGVVGDLADRAILHAVAEGSVERFMTRTAAVLDREAMSLGLEASRPFEHGE